MCDAEHAPGGGSEDGGSPGIAVFREYSAVVLSIFRQQAWFCEMLIIILLREL